MRLYFFLFLNKPKWLASYFNLILILIVQCAQVLYLAVVQLLFQFILQLALKASQVIGYLHTLYLYIEFLANNRALK